MSPRNIPQVGLGLVGYWRFDEGGGDTTRDQAGWHDGAIIGATWHPTRR